MYSAFPLFLLFLFAYISHNPDFAFAIIHRYIPRRTFFCQIFAVVPIRLYMVSHNPKFGIVHTPQYMYNVYSTIQVLLLILVADIFHDPDFTRQGSDPKIIVFIHVQTPG